MALDVPADVLQNITDGPLLHLAERARDWRSDSMRVPSSDLTDEALESLLPASEENQKFRRVVSAIMESRSGNVSERIPSFAAAAVMITEYLSRDAIRGWVFREGWDDHMHPFLVTDVRNRVGRDGDDFLEIVMVANGSSDGRLGAARSRVVIEPRDVARRRPADVLLDAGVIKETQELLDSHDAEVERYRAILTEGFAKQYRFTGMPALEDARWKGGSEARVSAKVVHDIAPKEIGHFSSTDQTVLFDGVAEVPIRTLLTVFDLATHTSLWVNSRDLTEHEYDKSLRDKIVLPEDQRELLDILTTDIEAFTADVIEGKSAGNVILCKGIPGVGKTMTAEVYSELIERPLYSIHSGSLGTSADSVRRSLEDVFKRARRWDAVLLLDEADVFVLERGDNITQNAIVAEFLRTLEYFDGLMFMTTNRAKDIDEAIISRCAAIIDYRVPNRADARRIWQVQAANAGAEMGDDLLDQLAEAFDGIAPRDIKMLLRLALRVAASKDEPLSLDVFRRCAMFRGLHAQVSPDKEGTS